MNRTTVEWVNQDQRPGFSWNPATGCNPAGKGCLHCYARAIAGRKLPAGGFTDREFSEVRIHPERLQEPWLQKTPARIFVCSMGDLYHANIPDYFRLQVMRMMASCSRHRFIIPTKRPGVAEHHHRHHGLLPENCILLLSVSDQVELRLKLPTLLRVRAMHKGLSCEPLLGPIKLEAVQAHELAEPWRLNAFTGLVSNPQNERKQHLGPGIEWVIVGGESGPGARPMNPDWARSLRDQAARYNVPFCFKQWGGTRKKAAGRLLDGVEHNGYPKAVEL